MLTEPRRTNASSETAALILLIGVWFFHISEARSSDVTPAAKAQALKDQYDRAPSADKKEIGENLIDAQLALAESLVSQNDFAGAQKALSQAMITAANIKSEKSKLVTSKLTSVSVRKTVSAKIESLRSSLLLKPNDPDTTRQLVDLLLLELNDVKAAQEAASGGDDEKLKKALQLAVKPIEELSLQETLDLADWYLGAAQRNTGTTRAAAQTRAAAALRFLLERVSLPPAIKAKAQPLFDGLPAEAKAKALDPDSAASSDTPIGLTAATIVQWIKSVPRDVSERRQGEQNYVRFQRVRDYLRKTYAAELGKTVRLRGTTSDRINFRKSDTSWEAEISIDLDTPPGPVKLRSSFRVPVTAAQMAKLAELPRATLDVEARINNLYTYMSNSEGDSVTYSLNVQDAKLISFK